MNTTLFQIYLKFIWPEFFSNFGWPDYLFYLQKLPDPPPPRAQSIGCPQNKPGIKRTKS